MTEPGIVPTPVAVSPVGARISRTRLAWRLIRRLTLLLLVLAVIGAGGLFWWVYAQVRGSLPQLEGAIRVQGLRFPVHIERDSLGIPTIRGDNRLDVAFATGFVHAQDRFFQMDLLRRHAAGELAELLGSGLVEEDRRARLHRFRAVARRTVAMASADNRRLLGAYVQGVEAGRRALAKPPFEYLALGVEPEPWTEEDSVLVGLEMFRSLQGEGFALEAARSTLYDTLPRRLADFLSPPGTEWDAPLEGPALPVPPIPGPEVFDLRKEPFLRPPLPKGRHVEARLDGFHAGSNNWAISGKRTAHGGALVANDMHLQLTVPNIWYRAAFVWPAEEEPGQEHHVLGATLPGVPVMIVGSNRHVAWGFTNTEGDWSDLVVLETDPNDPSRYRTPDGWYTIERHEETIAVRGGTAVTQRVEDTIWGPIYDSDSKGRRRALHWIAHDPTVVGFGLMAMETAKSVNEALALAPRGGTPAQNLMVGDAQGHIGWTVIGRMPRRVGFDGRLPVSWADGSCRWDGWLADEEYPRIVDPPGGCLWSANNRLVDGEKMARIGLGQYDLGARARQIRDRLHEKPLLREEDMLALQLDDRALFLARWQKLFLDVLTPAALKADGRRAPLREAVADWGGRASVDSRGFRIVQNFRRHVHRFILEALTARCRIAQLSFRVSDLDHQVEGAVWRLLQERPLHLLPRSHASWDALLLAAVDEERTKVQGKAATVKEGLQGYTWGAVNQVGFYHPFSVKPILRWWLGLDLPTRPLPGASHMPRIQAPSYDPYPAFGASERMAVAPGHEAEGYFHMPAGQSGHPLSPHFRDGHAAWVEGKPTPFLPGPPLHVLTLVPES